MGSSIKFVHLDYLRQIWFVCFWVDVHNVQDFLFFHCSVHCSVNLDGDKINFDQLFSDFLLVSYGRLRCDQNKTTRA